MSRSENGNGVGFGRVLYRIGRIASDVWQDVQHGAFLLKRRPGSTVAGVLTMALGIGASVTVFSFADSIFLRPLHVANADRLVRVRLISNSRDGFWSMAEYRLFRERAHSFDQVIAHYSAAPLSITADNQSEEVLGAVVSGNYFLTLGIKPLRGRFFTPDEDVVPDRNPVVVVGYDFWQSRFGGDPAIVGKELRINGKDFQVIGVAPAGFRGVLPGGAADNLWIPTMMFRTGYRWCDALGDQPSCAIAEVLARLAPHASVRTAQSEVASIQRQLIALSDPADSLRAALVEPARGVEGSRGYIDLTRLLATIAAFLLAVACAGSSGLLLASTTARETELAIRSALGAKPARLVRQLVVESVLLTAMGSIAGIIASLWGVRALTGFYTAVGWEGSLSPFEVSLDAHVLEFAVGVSAIAALLLSVAPAIHASRVDLAQRFGRWRSSSTRARQALLAFQVAVSVVMLIAAGLLTKSFAHLSGAGGFDPRHVVVMRLRPQLVSYAPDAAQNFIREAVRRIRETPGVEDVGFAHGVGLPWGSSGEIAVRRPGETSVAGAPAQQVDFQVISPRFFATLKIPMVAGRDFTDRDAPNTPHVAIVDDLLAERLWPNQRAIGQEIVLDTLRCTVVGVVRHYRLTTMVQSPPAMAFLPFWQNDFGPEPDVRVAVRVRGDPTSAIHPIRAAISKAGPIVPVTELVPLVQQVGSAYMTVHLVGSVLLLAALLGVALSAIGLYGITALLVAQATREIGIRMAIGARSTTVVAHFLERGLRGAAVGAIIGLGAALVTTRLLGAWLVGVRPLDPLAFVGAGVVMCVAALASSFIPARRAALVDPVIALKGD